MPRRRLPGTLAVSATVGCILLWLVASGRTTSGVRLAMVIAAVCCHALVMVIGRRPGALTRTAVVTGIVVVLAGAMVFPPRDSNDLWGYVSYARVLSVHHANPYVHPPSDYPDDPLLHRMSEEYRTTPTIYGPAFTAASAIGTSVVGGSPLLNRLFFQAMALASMVAALVLVDRRSGRDPTALAFLGLSPIGVAIVNGAHTDLLIGAAILGAVMAISGRRTVLVGGLLALATLVKVVAVVPAIGLLVWLWRKHGHRAALTAGGVAAALVSAAYLVVGGVDALQPVRDARLFATRGQAWELLRAHWSDALAAEGVRHAAEIAHTDVARIALPVVGLAVLVAIWRLSRDRDPAVPTTGAGLGYLLTAPYVLPWYPGWIAPAAAAAWRSPVAVFAQLQASLVFLVYADPPGRLPEDGPLFELSTRYLPYAGVVQAVAFVGWCLLGPRPRPDHARRPDTETGAVQPSVPSAS